MNMKKPLIDTVNRFTGLKEVKGQLCARFLLAASILATNTTPFGRPSFANMDYTLTSDEVDTHLAHLEAETAQGKLDTYYVQGTKDELLKAKNAFRALKQ